MKRSGGSIKKRLEEVTKMQSTRAEVGIMEDAKYPDGQQVAQIAFDNEYGTEKVPSRPALRNAIRNNIDELKRMASLLMAKHGDAETVLSLLCGHMINEFREEIIAFDDPQNADYTIEKKGFDNPLIETRQFLRSFAYEVMNDE